MYISPEETDKFTEDILNITKNTFWNKLFNMDMFKVVSPFKEEQANITNGIFYFVQKTNKPINLDKFITIFVTNNYVSEVKDKKIINVAVPDNDPNTIDKISQDSIFKLRDNFLTKLKHPTKLSVNDFTKEDELINRMDIRFDKAKEGEKALTILPKEQSLEFLKMMAIYFKANPEKIREDFSKTLGKDKSYIYQNLMLLKFFGENSLNDAIKTATKALFGSNKNFTIGSLKKSLESFKKANDLNMNQIIDISTKIIDGAKLHPILETLQFKEFDVIDKLIDFSKFTKENSPAPKTTEVPKKESIFESIALFYEADGEEIKVDKGQEISPATATKKGKEIVLNQKGEQVPQPEEAKPEDKTKKEKYKKQGLWNGLVLYTNEASKEKEIYYKVSETDENFYKMDDKLKEIDLKKTSKKINITMSFQNSALAIMIVPLLEYINGKTLEGYMYKISYNKDKYVMNSMTPAKDDYSIINFFQDVDNYDLKKDKDAVKIKKRIDDKFGTENYDDFVNFFASPDKIKTGIKSDKDKIAIMKNINNALKSVETQDTAYPTFIQDIKMLNIDFNKTKPEEILKNENTKQILSKLIITEGKYAK